MIRKVLLFTIVVILTLSAPVSAAAAGRDERISQSGAAAVVCVEDENGAVTTGIIDTACPKCGSIGTPLKVWYDSSTSLLWYMFECSRCGNIWNAATDVNTAEITEEAVSAE